MSVDAKAFRRTVGHFVTGVTIVAADIEGTIRGMTANAFTALSLDPPLVLFCVAKRAHLGQGIHRASGYSVNILTPRAAATLGLLCGRMERTWATVVHVRTMGRRAFASRRGRCSWMRGRDDL